MFDVPTILQIVMLIVGYSNWMDFAYFNKEIIEKTLFYLNNAKIPFNHYMFKVECCEIFKILAIKSLETSEYVIGAFHVIFFNYFYLNIHKGKNYKCFNGSNKR